MNDMTEEMSVDLAINRLRGHKFKSIYRPANFDLLLMTANSFGDMKDISLTETGEPKAPTYIYSQSDDGEGMLVLQEASRDDAVPTADREYFSVLTNINSKDDQIENLPRFDYKYLNKAGFQKLQTVEMKPRFKAKMYTHGVFMDGLDKFQELTKRNQSFNKMIKGLLGVKLVGKDEVMKHAILLIDTSNEIWETYLIESYKDVKNILDI